MNFVLTDSDESCCKTEIRHAPYLMQVFQCQYDLSAVQSHLLLFEMDPLHQMCEELASIHIVCNQTLASI